jgi:hypothetical protein
MIAVERLDLSAYEMAIANADSMVNGTVCPDTMGAAVDVVDMAGGNPCK